MGAVFDIFGPRVGLRLGLRLVSGVWVMFGRCLKPTGQSKLVGVFVWAFLKDVISEMLIN